MREKYGYTFADETVDLTIEMYCFWDPTPESLDSGNISKAEHFWNIVDILWNYEGSPHPFHHTPWAQEMVLEACENKFLAVAGCASSGKSGLFAAWAIINFLCDPVDTKCFVSSTSLKASQNRIWGTIIKLWRSIHPDVRPPGKLVDSLGIIKYVNEKGEAFSTSGLEVIACQQSREKEAVEKLIGFKAPRVVFVADELPEMTEAILNAGIYNLSANPSFQLVGLGNPKSYYDAFGTFCEPKNGWESICRESTEWETRYGKCIRFDAHESPNVKAGKNIYDFMPKIEWIEEIKRQTGGENSPGYWRMVRGFWSPTGEEDDIYSEADILMYGGYQDVVWASPPKSLTSLDPSFTDGGDRAIQRFGEIGTSIDGLLTLHFTDWVALTSNIKSERSRTLQIATQFRDNALARGILPRHASIDSTGGGGPFWDVLTDVWSNEILQVGFGGRGSDRRVSDQDPVPCWVRYANKATQLWFAGVDLLRAGQLKGIDKETTQELVARKYKVKKPPPHEKDTLGMQYVIEPKKEMKSRVGFSPDLGDSAAVMIELAIERFGLRIGTTPENRRAGGDASWTNFCRQQDVTAMSDNFLYWQP